MGKGISLRDPGPNLQRGLTTHGLIHGMSCHHTGWPKYCLAGMVFAQAISSLFKHTDLIRPWKEWSISGCSQPG